MMTEQMTATELEATYPSLAPAQAFVLPAYQLMLGRVEAAESRLQAVITTATTMSFAVPALGRAFNTELSLRSPWLVAAIAVAVIIVVAGAFARMWGRVALVNPSRLYDKSMHLSPWEFARDALYFAGQDFDHNRNLVETKTTVVMYLTVGLAVDIALFATWMISGASVAPLP